MISSTKTWPPSSLAVERVGRFVICVVISCVLPYSAAAQQTGQSQSAPTVGGTLPVPARVAPTFGSSNSTEILRHRDFAGKPCLTVVGFARPHIIDPNLYDHVINVRNDCPQRIAMQVCYYQTHDCIPIEIPGDQRKEAILGSLPAAKDFRFEFREKF
jgi:hypothetical protein